MGRVKILCWSDRDDPIRIDVVMGEVVVTFDVIEVTFDIKSREEGDLLMSGQQSYILFK